MWWHQLPDSWFDTPETIPANHLSMPGIQEYFISGPAYQGRATRIYCCIGLPDGASAASPVPGVVLVHGGGGTAFADWIQYWNRRGYAAIAMDCCGSTPCWAPNPHCHEWPRHEASGPAGWGRMEEALLPPEEQWAYHATGAVVLAHSLLRSLPEVKPDAIGVTGISWGGVLSCIAGGVDARLKFVMPVYGCGFFNTGESSLTEHVVRELRDAWFGLWDPGHLLPEIRAPFFLLTGTNDLPFPLDAAIRSYDAVPSAKRQLLIPAYSHDHTISWSEETIYDFADAVLRGRKLPKPGEIKLSGDVLNARVESAEAIVDAEFHYTRASGFCADRLWRSEPAEFDHQELRHICPAGCRQAYFSIRCANGARYSTPVWSITR